MVTLEIYLVWLGVTEFKKVFIPLYSVQTVLTLVVIYFFVLATKCDVTDPIIYYQRLNDQKKDLLDDIKQQHIMFCHKCKLYTQKFTKHCGQCNRCCHKFDHHCKWLNNCIGEYNYFYFIKLCISLLL